MGTMCSHVSPRQQTSLSSRSASQECPWLAQLASTRSDPNCSQVSLQGPSMPIWATSSLAWSDLDGPGHHGKSRWTTHPPPKQRRAFPPTPPRLFCMAIRRARRQPGELALLSEPGGSRASSVPSPAALRAALRTETDVGRHGREQNLAKAKLGKAKAGTLPGSFPA